MLCAEKQLSKQIFCKYYCFSLELSVRRAEACNLTQGLLLVWCQGFTVTTEAGCSPLSGRHFKKGSPKQSSGYKGLNTQSDTKVMAWKVPSLEKPKEKAHRLGCEPSFKGDTNPTAQIELE